jgi:hypothetical protein
MASKVYCDFCGKEMDIRFETVGKMVVVSNTINLTTVLAGSPQQMQAKDKAEEFDLCGECCKKALNALK